MARELVTELETCKEQNRSLHREVESLKQSLAASEVSDSSGLCCCVLCQEVATSGTCIIVEGSSVQHWGYSLTSG